MAPKLSEITQGELDKLWEEIDSDLQFDPSLYPDEHEKQRIPASRHLTHARGGER